MTRYGPHRPADAPNAVPVLHADRRSGLPPRWSSEPLPAALVRQREQLNTRAHRGGAA